MRSTKLTAGSLTILLDLGTLCPCVGTESEAGGVITGMKTIEAMPGRVVQTIDDLTVSDVSLTARLNIRMDKEGGSLPSN